MAKYNSNQDNQDSQITEETLDGKEQLITLNKADIEEHKLKNEPISSTRTECINWFVLKEEEAIKKKKNKIMELKG